jgi:hypothetical protein
MFKYRVKVDFRETADLHHIFLKCFLFLRLARIYKFRISFRDVVGDGRSFIRAATAILPSQAQ